MVNRTTRQERSTGQSSRPCPRAARRPSRRGSSGTAARKARMDGGQGGAVFQLAPGEERLGGMDQYISRLRCKNIQGGSATEHPSRAELGEKSGKPRGVSAPEREIQGVAG